MNFRISSTSLARAALSSLNSAQDRIGRAQEQVATGRRINRPSDAPLDAAQASRLHTYTNQLRQYQRNLDEAQARLEFASSSIQEVSDIFIEARQIALRAADSATDPSERRTLATAVNQLLEGLIQRANTSWGGRYIFAGTADDTTPFEGRIGQSGYIDSVLYHGNDGRVELQVGPRMRVQVNEPGTEIFAATATRPSLFDVLIELRDLLTNADGLSESDQCRALSAHVGALKEAHERVVDAASRLGWRARQVEYTRTTVENLGLTATERLSGLEDTDYAYAALEITAQRVALEAALAVSARLMKNSLLEYL